MQRIWLLIPVFLACGGRDSGAPVRETSAQTHREHAPVVHQLPKDSLPPDAREVHTRKRTSETHFDKAYLMGQFDPAIHPDFVPVPARYCSRGGMYLRREVLDAFVRMHDAALRDGIRLTIRSATRNFDAQKRIWVGKWTGRRPIEGGENLARTTPDPVERARKILRYSSMPGSSRHHWGTDVDLNYLANSYFKKGRGYKMYRWMKKHAAEYGFYQVYTAKGPERPVGYEEERWHWTYLPTSKKILDQARKVLKDTDFRGFPGAETAPAIGIVRNYVLGINPECLSN